MEVTELSVLNEKIILTEYGVLTELSVFTVEKQLNVNSRKVSRE